MKQSKFLSLICGLLSTVLVLTACGGANSAAQIVPTEVPAKTRTVLSSITTELFLEGMNICTREEFHYDEQGLLKEIVSYSGDQEVSRTALENDDHGEVIRQTTHSGENTTITESENTYDDDGNLIKKVDAVSTNGVVTDIREYTYRPDHKPLTASFTRTGDNGYTTSNSYEYDDRGNQTAVIQESNGTASRTEVVFDENDRALRSVTTNSDGIVTLRAEYDYANDGTVTQTTTSQATGQISRTVTKYDAQGAMVSQEVWSGDALNQRITCTYIIVPAFK